MVKLGDFGIARVLNATTELAKTACGTPYYMSPEICDNKAYNDKSDVWSMGCLLYEMATLKCPFDARDMRGLIIKILRGAYPPLPRTFSSDLSGLVGKCLERQPSKRPSVNELLALPLIRKRIERFLSDAERASEFAHTVLHRDPAKNHQHPAAPKADAAAEGVTMMGPPPSQRGRGPAATGAAAGGNHDERLAARKQEEYERARAAERRARVEAEERLASERLAEERRMREAAERKLHEERKEREARAAARKKAEEAERREREAARAEEAARRRERQAEDARRRGEEAEKRMRAERRAREEENRRAREEEGAPARARRAARASRR